MKKGRTLKTLALMLLFAMVFTTAVTISAGDGAFAARRKNTQYNLGGAEYWLYTDSACTKRAKDANGNNAVLTTDANGNTQPLEMEVGTYYAKEVKTGIGYKFDPNYRSTPGFEVEVKKTNTEENPKTINSTEPPIYGTPNFKVYKLDKDGKYGWRELQDAEFTIKYYDVATKAEIASAEPMDTWKFKTKKMNGERPTIYYAGFDFEEDEPLPGSSDFYVVNGKRVIPLGWFTIQETDAPNGLALNDKIFYGQVYQDGQPGAGGDAVTKIEGATAAGNLEVPVDVEDKDQSVTISVKKELAEGVELIDAATLAGAKYNVYYDKDTMSQPVLVGTITTDEEGKGTLTKDTEGNNLEPGDYLIEETQAPPGFLIDKYTLAEDGSTVEVTGDIEVICGYDSNGQPVTKTITGSYKNGQHIFKARVQTTNTEVFNYTVKSLEEPTQTHVKKIDAVTSEEVPGAKLQIFSLNEGSKGELMEEWTSTEEEHIVYGLPSGTYLLRETTAPKGYDIAEDAEFEVSDSEIVNKVEMKNKPIEVGTTALDGTTGTHQGVKDTETTLVDTVKITGLDEGRSYKVSGILMDQSTGEAFVDSEGKEITSETEEFTATGNEMEVELTFTFDSSNFDPKTTLVAFEKLYRTKAIPVKEGYPERTDEEELPKEVASHEDIDDEGQSVHFGGIASTVAVDTKSKSHNVLSADSMSVTDTVAYENLVAGQKYLLEGEWYDKTTGQLTGEKASKTFTPEASDGTVDVVFNFDTSKYEGHTLVCYEKLSVIPQDEEGQDKDPIDVDKHEDPDDEDQTVHIPEIGTTATSTETDEHMTMAKEDITIKDVVKYHNLIPGKTYTLKGKLVYNDTGDSVVDNGKAVTAETEFTPNDYDGEVELTFTFNGSALAGKTVVAFEEVYENNYLVAVHAELDDKEQSVQSPDARTNAVDSETKDHISHGDKEITVIDNVTYRNLIAGKKYTVKGVLMNATTGQPVLVNGKKVTAKKSFTAEKKNGEVSLTFKFDGTGLHGEKVVVFENVYYKNILVAAHADLTDKNQSVVIPKIGTKVGRLNGSVVTDTVAYKNLLPGRKYIVKGWFVDKKSGSAVPGSNNSLEFTPSEANGYVNIDLKPGSHRSAMVAFEEVYIINKDGREVLVGEHKDINDPDQLFTPAPATGDNNTVFLIGGAFLLAAMLALVLVLRKKKASAL